MQTKLTGAKLFFEDLKTGADRRLSQERIQKNEEVLQI
jgi:hypothetical protein